MKETIKILELDRYELGIIVNALNRFRTEILESNKSAKDKQDVKPIEEVLLKVFDAPEKKRPFVRCLRKDERRYY